jgi:hypothetical protein
MTTTIGEPACSARDVAHILGASATLMESFFQSDLALQDAIANLSATASSAVDVTSLQHADLLTQTHADLARLLGALSDVLGGEAIGLGDLKKTLTLRSLETALFDPDDADPAPESGELSLF